MDLLQPGFDASVFTRNRQWPMTNRTGQVLFDATRQAADREGCRLSRPQPNEDQLSIRWPHRGGERRHGIRAGLRHRHREPVSLDVRVRVLFPAKGPQVSHGLVTVAGMWVTSVVRGDHVCAAGD